MKRTLLIAGLVFATLFSTSAAAFADHPRWGFGFRFGSGGARFEGGFSHSHRSRHIHRGCRHVRVPMYTRVWVAPVYNQIFCGYDRYGCPVYKQVLVTGGHWRSTVSGYRCGSCGVHC